MQLQIENLPLDEIQPYWRNPRVIPESAIAAVAESIKRFGYNAPIVVDRDNVIVVGHTRYAALSQLGAKNISVVRVDLDSRRARAYRLADNRTGDLTEWDFNSLTFELRELNDTYIDQLFNEEEVAKGFKPMSDHEFDHTFGNILPATPPKMETATCPHCGKTVEMTGHRANA